MAFKIHNSPVDKKPRKAKSRNGDYYYFCSVHVFCVAIWSFCIFALWRWRFKLRAIKRELLQFLFPFLYRSQKKICAQKGLEENCFFSSVPEKSRSNESLLASRHGWKCACRSEIRRPAVFTFWLHKMEREKFAKKSLSFSKGLRNRQLTPKREFGINCADFFARWSHLSEKFPL